MNIHVEGIGNLGADPVKKEVEVDGEKKTIVEMRVRFVRMRKKGDRYEDEGGFWANVTIWNEALGSRAHALFEKGSRIFVSGEIRADRFTGDDEQERETMIVNAAYVAIDTFGVISVERVQKKREEEDSGEPMRAAS